MINQMCSFRHKPPHGQLSLVLISAGLSAFNLLAGLDEPAADLPVFSPIEPSAVMAIAADVNTNRFPDADAVVIDNRIATRYEPDGTSATLDESYIKILTERGRRQYRTRGLRHVFPYDTVEILEAAVLRPDGSQRPIDPAQYARDMVEPSQMQSNIYNPNNRLLRLTFPGVEIGDVLYLRTLERTVKPRVPETWSSYATFEYSIPILHTEFRVEAPNALPLQHRVLRDPIPGTVDYHAEPLSAHHTLHRWTVSDVPRMFPEPNMPPAYTQVQRLLLSTIPDWEHLARWYWNLSKPALEAVTDAMRDTVDSLVADAPDRDTRIQRIFTYVSQNIRYMGLTTETEAPGYEPRNVGVTFENQYGVCRDKAAVLVSMLRLAGLPAYPVLIHTQARKDPEVPLPYFNHAIVAVERQGETGFALMDPTDETVRERMPAFLGNRHYLVAHPEGKTLQLSPVSPADRNLVRIETTGTLRDNEGLDVVSRIAFEGINDQAYRSFFARQTPENRRQFAEGLVAARLSGAELTDFQLNPENPTDTEQPLELTLRARVRHYPVLPPDETYGRIALPWLGDALGYVNFVIGDTGLQSRKYPLETGMACGVTETISIDLAAGNLTLPVMPQPIEIRIEGANFVQSFSLESPGRLAASSRFMLKAPTFSPEAYLELKKLLADIEYAYRQRPRIRRVTASPPDSRLLLAERHVQIETPASWTTTHRLRREVLTFAGARRHAELKVPYNTGWQSAELIQATVSNQNGRVQTVVPDEINRMDDAWVGGAPRYPASQTLVVSLPGVQAGSVIDITYQTRLQDAPFFGLRHGFRNEAPVEQGVLSIETPQSLDLNLAVHQPLALHYRAVTNDATVLHRWEAEPQPRIQTEDNRPPDWFLGPAVFASSSTPETYADIVYAELESRIDTFDAGRLAHQTGTVFDGSASPAGNIRQIRDFVLRAIRPAGPGFTALPLGTLSPANDTLQDGYGHQADRAILMTAILRAADIQASPVLVSASASQVEALRNPLLNPLPYGLFDQVLVRVESADTVYYLNDTSHYAPLDICAHVNQLTLERDGRLGRIERPEHFHDATRTDWLLTLMPNGDVLARQTDTYFGMSIAGFRQQYAEMTPEQRNRHHQELVGKLSRAAEIDGELLTDLQTYPGKRQVSARLPRFAIRETDSLTLLLPDSPRGLGVRGDQRKTPFYLSQPRRDTTTWTLLLPDTLTTVALKPDTVTWSLPDNLGTVHFKTRQATCPETGQPSLRLSRQITLAPGLLPPERYAAWREVHRRMLHPSMGLVEIQ